MPILLRSARASDAGGICALHVESWRDSYAGTLDPGFLAEEIEDAFAAHWQDRLRGRRRPGQVVMAVTGHQVEGFAAGLIEDGNGHVEALHVRAEMRDRGIGRSLLGLLAQRMRQQGARSADLWVFSANAGAARLYKRLGGQIGPATQRQSFGQAVTERRVAWPRIEALIGACGEAGHTKP